LGTGVGAVPVAEAAEEMAKAYGDWRKATEPGAPADGGRDLGFS
jgi:hypothetical protein